jgi:hypothetical protein
LVTAFIVRRWYAIFVLVAFVVTILEFAVVAGLDPRIGSQLFVLERFYLMPLVILAPMGAVGLAWLAEWIASRQHATGSKTATIIAASITSVVVIACGVLAALNFSTNNVANDKVTDQYARSVLEGLQPNAILFVTNDYADVPVLYAQAVEHVRPDVSVIVSPILPAPWYQDELRHHGNFIMPAQVNTLNIVTANPGRPVAFVGNPPDKSLNGKYYLAIDGLTYNLVPEAVKVGVATTASQNLAKLATYVIPARSSIKPVSYEQGILDEYANIPATIGHYYVAAGHPKDAISWYVRAHLIDPSSVPINQELAKLRAG